MNLKKAQLRFALGFSVLLFFCAGIRACDNTVTFGFPVIAWEFTDTHSFIFHHDNFFINTFFILFSFYFAFKFTCSARWQKNKNFRKASAAVLFYLIYADLIYLLLSFVPISLTNFATKFFEFLSGIALFPVLMCNLPFNHTDFKQVLISHPILTHFYPHGDDLNYRLNILPALVLIFLLSWGIFTLIEKIKLKIKSRNTSL